MCGEAMLHAEVYKIIKEQNLVDIISLSYSITKSVKKCANKNVQRRRRRKVNHVLLWSDPLPSGLYANVNLLLLLDTFKKKKSDSCEMHEKSEIVNLHLH